MTPTRPFHRFIVIPAHLGLVLRWDSPRTRAAQFDLVVPSLRPVHILN